MARNVSDEELQLKKRARRRLVGAIVLATAVAVVLPMILDSEPKPANQSIDIQIPSPDAGVLSEKSAPLKKPAESPAAAVAPASPPDAKAKPETKAEPKPESEPKPEPKSEPKPAPAKPITKPETKSETTARPAGHAAEKAKPAAGSFVVQVVALSDVGRARELQAKISASGLKAYTEVVQTANGPVTRVRVGPYPSREAAEKGRQQLQRLKLDGKVVPR